MNVFCNFADCVREVMMKISAMLLVVWYCMSIIGFDVHTCMTSGESFVVTVLEGTDCGDIHPEHTCCADALSHCCSCCHHDGPSEHDGAVSLEEQDCCQDDIQVLVLTGGRSDDESRHHYDMVSLYASVAVEPCFSVASRNFFNSLSMPDSGLIVPGESQSFLSVWRI